MRMFTSPPATCLTLPWSSPAMPIRLSLIHYKKVLITKPAIAQLEEMLG